MVSRVLNGTKVDLASRISAKIDKQVFEVIFLCFEWNSIFQTSTRSETDSDFGSLSSSPSSSTSKSKSCDTEDQPLDLSISKKFKLEPIEFWAYSDKKRINITHFHTKQHTTKRITTPNNVFLYRKKVIPHFLHSRNYNTKKRLDFHLLPSRFFQWCYCCSHIYQKLVFLQNKEDFEKFFPPFACN